MRLQDIPVGHLALCNSGGDICLRGDSTYLWLDGGNSYPISKSYCDYTDLGKLKIDIQEVMQYVVKATVE